MTSTLTDPTPANLPSLPTLRTARPDDLEAIVALTEREFKAASMDARMEQMVGGTPWIDIKRDALEKELLQNPAGCFIAETEGRLIGYVTTTILPVAARGIIANLAVDSTCRGLNLGRLLIQKALDFFRAKGLQQAKIETLETNQAGRHIYPSLGFREVVKQVHYIMPL